MKKLIYTITIVIFLSSCEKKTEFTIEYPQSKPAVNCLINPDSTVKLYLSKSLTPVDTINFKSIENAVPEIFKNNQSLGILNTYIKPERNPGIAYYTASGIIVNSGDSIKINISHNDFNMVEAKTSIPQKPVADIELSDYSFEPVPNQIVNGYNLNASIKISLTDNNNSDNYYSISMYYFANDLPYPNNTDTVYRDIIHFTINSEKVIKTYKFNEGYIFSDKDFENNRQIFYLYADDLMSVKSPEFFKFYVEVKSLSKDFFLYQKTLKEYYESINNPFSEPVKVYGNINNGYGIFAGYNSIIDTINVNI